MSIDKFNPPSDMARNENGRLLLVKKLQHSTFNIKKVFVPDIKPFFLPLQTENKDYSV